MQLIASQTQFALARAIARVEFCQPVSLTEAMKIDIVKLIVEFKNFKGFSPQK
jgi:hypothetical protein